MPNIIQTNHESFTSILKQWNNFKASPSRDMSMGDIRQGDNITDRIAGKVSKDFLKSTSEVVRVYGPDGKLFDRNFYIFQYLNFLKKEQKRYQNEIYHLNMMISELEPMIAKVIETDSTIKKRLKELKHKRTQKQDIDFISPARMKELDRVRQLQIRPIEINKTLSTLSNSQIQEKSVDIISMQASYHLADTSDPEVNYMLHRAHNLRGILGIDT